MCFKRKEAFPTAKDTLYQTKLANVSGLAKDGSTLVLIFDLKGKV